MAFNQYRNIAMHSPVNELNDEMSSPSLTQQGASNKRKNSDEIGHRTSGNALWGKNTILSSNPISEESDSEPPPNMALLKRKTTDESGLVGKPLANSCYGKSLGAPAQQQLTESRFVAVAGAMQRQQSVEQHRESGNGATAHHDDGPPGWTLVGEKSGIYLKMQHTYFKQRVSSSELLLMRWWRSKEGVWCNSGYPISFSLQESEAMASLITSLLEEN